MTNSTNSEILLISSTPLEYVQDFIYLGQLVSFINREEKEIQGRVTKAWNQYWSINSLFKLQLPMTSKKGFFDSSILPVLNYSAQTRSNHIQTTNAIRTCQRSMERSVLGVRRTDRVRCRDIREVTNFEDAVEKSKKLKWDWAVHVFRMSDNRWTSLITDWIPLDQTEI